MCGIVGTAGNLTAMDEKIFKELLYADVVRGRHATGVATVKGQCRDIKVHKRAVPAALYLELGSTSAHLASFVNNTVVLGHNRHATKGNSSDPEGAHPFQHGDITLVHNGSLTTHHNLTPEYYTVDSEAICKAISTDGIEAVAPKLQGAFALVWIDSSDNTLNFFRNEEREFAIAWNETANRMWWASEMGMLKWQLNRDTFTRTPVHTTEEFELPVGKWISIPITHTGINIAGRVETELELYVPPVPKHQRSLSSSDSNAAILRNQAGGIGVGNETTTEYVFGPKRESALKKTTAALVSGRGRENFMVRSFVSSLDMNADAAVLDERIGVFITNWVPYSATNSKFGSLIGQMMEYPYTNVLIHNYTEKEYTIMYNKYSGMLTGYLTGFVAPLSSSITVKQGTLLEQEDLLKFDLVLRKDSVRKADLDKFYWDLDKMPQEDSKVIEKAAKIDAGLELVVSNPGPKDPMRVFALSDGTQVSPQGTAIFKGISTKLDNGYRYNIVSVAYQAMTKKTLLTAQIGQDRFVYCSTNWELGTLSKEADTEEGQSLILGPDGEFITVGKWRVAVSKGCCHCNEVPTDPKVADTLEWVGNRFTCELCHFDTMNLGYT